MKTKAGIKLNFGDVIINHHASERNPHRVGVVLAVNKHIELTDSKGDFWQLINDRETLITIIGNCFEKEEFERMSYEQR